ncbi:LANO_0F13476g1_1 [Lachancea nothofagi CBS 11611]|uniref:LANO_0F13476g1_1 n=1 Tax=Lachancea nothofagi CBS 11611 TaxID=1266666 RepID=A0A1G4KBU3_9SACH|nr:LANO_0F13476g1_1 [Lachancea nothofagi CBS 11611]
MDFKQIETGEINAFWRCAVEFLNQNDLLALGRTNKYFNELCSKKLYEKIVISRDPVLRSQEWYLDCGKSYVAGYRSWKKSQDQNDLFLYDRVVRLTGSSQLALVKEVVIQEDVFNNEKEGLVVLEQLVEKLIALDQLEVLDIRDSVLFSRFYSQYLKLSNLRQCQIWNVADLEQLQSVEKVKSLKLVLKQPRFDSLSLSQRVKSALSHNLVELAVDDLEHSSLRLFQYFCTEGLILKAVRSLKFNHVHGIHDYNKTMREITILFLKDTFLLEKISCLEFEGSCEITECSCFNDFLMDLAPYLHSLRELGLIERTFITQGDHYTEENWDLSVNKFVLHLPDVSERLKKLSIRHNPPLNGITIDSVEGNYVRRRTLYENVLPKLTSLESLIAPTFLRSVAAYEVLVCDLLWNGCECDFCAKVLAVIDAFIMNHQFYSYPDGGFKDIIPTVFFAYTGDALERRFVTETDWDLKTSSICPVTHAWDLHGYENIQHFQDYECHFDESAYVALCTCVAHFFNSYMDRLVKYLPSLRWCVLSGIYYAVNDNNEYRSIYD